MITAGEDLSHVLEDEIVTVAAVRLEDLGKKGSVQQHVADGQKRCLRLLRRIGRSLEKRLFRLKSGIEAAVLFKSVSVQTSEADLRGRRAVRGAQAQDTAVRPDGHVLELCVGVVGKTVVPAHVRPEYDGRQLPAVLRLIKQNVFADEAAEAVRIRPAVLNGFQYVGVYQLRDPAQTFPGKFMRIRKPVRKAFDEIQAASDYDPDPGLERVETRSRFDLQQDRAAVAEPFKRILLQAQRIRSAVNGVQLSFRLNAFQYDAYVRKRIKSCRFRRCFGRFRRCFGMLRGAFAFSGGCRAFYRALFRRFRNGRLSFGRCRDEGRRALRVFFLI